MILILQGLPASGKTTFRNDWVMQDPAKRRYANYDEARRTMFGAGWVFNHAQEKDMKQAVMTGAREVLTSGYDLIIDNTNLSERHYQKWIQLADEFKVPYEIKKLDTPLHVCVNQDSRRGKGRVGRAVIEGMALRNGYIDWNDASLYHGQNFMIVDVDGTVANQGERAKLMDVKCLNCGYVNPPRLKNGKCGQGLFPIDKALLPGGLCGGEVTKKDHATYFAQAGYDTPHNDIIRLVQTMAEEFIPLIVSGRPDDKCGTITEEWLERFGVPFEHLFMRRGGDYTNDDLVKEEILSFLPKDRISFVLDDRDRVVQMWRRNGLRCLQVANGAF